MARPCAYEPDFKTRGVEVVVVSSDEGERARRTAPEWQLGNLTVGYGLDLTVARARGLYISSSRGKTSLGIEEPPLFSEPGVFWCAPDGTLYWSAVQTMPFARPHFRELLTAVDFVISKDYPARGEVP